MAKPTIKVGDVFETNGYGRCRVVKYVNANNVYVRFMRNDHVIVKTGAQPLRLGKVKNPYHPTIHGKGYVGKGKYKPNTHRRLYEQWFAMLRRCYDPRFQSVHTAYKGSVVCDKWHNFQHFCEWAVRMPNQNTPGFHLDKDLRALGLNKVYSPEHCSFVNSKLNSIFGGNTIGRSGYFGVRYEADCVRKYHVRYGNKSYWFHTGISAYKTFLDLKLADLKRYAKLNRQDMHEDIHRNLNTLTRKKLSRVLKLFLKDRRS